jgi:RNAse (barnase) inhibitor barstar
VRVVIDGRCVLDEADLHRRLAGAFGYGPLYRPCLGDLRDRLAAGDPRPLQLTCINASALRMALGTARFDELITLLRAIETSDAGKDWAERFVVWIFE